MLEDLLKTIFVLLGLGVAFLINGYFWGWYYSSSTKQDETYYIVTDDGWRLALHRYRSRKELEGLPVILCHGFTSNRYMFDMPGCPSLADFLRRNGRDVWVPELRGSGMSQRPGMFVSDVPFSWNFDEHLLCDMPVIIRSVCEISGAESLHWVGHSMGGMLIQAHLSNEQAPRVCSAVTLGSPADFSKISMRAIWVMSRLRWVLQIVPLPFMPFNARLVIPIAHKIPEYLLGLFNSQNIEPDTVKKMLSLGSELITSRKVWMDLGRFVHTGVFSPPDGRPYLNDLPRSKVPILIAGGSRDMIAPPESLVDQNASERSIGERTLHIFGKTFGTLEDYGHIDLLLGSRVEHEVYPLILRWLRDHETNSN